jgi:hypothetical protein
MKNAMLESVSISIGVEVVLTEKWTCELSSKVSSQILHKVQAPE